MTSTRPARIIALAVAMIPVLLLAYYFTLKLSGFIADNGLGSRAWYILALYAVLLIPGLYIVYRLVRSVREGSADVEPLWLLVFLCYPYLMFAGTTAMFLGG